MEPQLVRVRVASGVRVSTTFSTYIFPDPVPEPPGLGWFMDTPNHLFYIVRHPWP